MTWFDEAIKKDAPITMNDVSPFMHSNGKSTVRNCAEVAMMTCGLDPSEWRTRDKVIWAMNPWIQAEAEARVEMAESRDLLRNYQDAIKALEFIVGFDDIDDLVRDIAVKAIERKT
jgi:hypothetical protein